MTGRREKVAPWELYTDGEWHVIRTGPVGEGRAESLRQYRRHYESMREWCRINRMRGQLSRSDAGRILRTRIRPDDQAAERDRIVAALRAKSRSQLGLGLVDAVRLLERMQNLRQYGVGPHPDETWVDLDRDTELFLRRLEHEGDGHAE